jgi:hypothetical protein
VCSSSSIVVPPAPELTREVFSAPQLSRDVFSTRTIFVDALDGREMEMQRFDTMKSIYVDALDGSHVEGFDVDDEVEVTDSLQIAVVAEDDNGILPSTWTLLTRSPNDKGRRRAIFHRNIAPRIPSKVRSRPEIPVINVHRVFRFGQEAQANEDWWAMVFLVCEFDVGLLRERLSCCVVRRDGCSMVWNDRGYRGRNQGWVYDIYHFVPFEGLLSADGFQDNVAYPNVLGGILSPINFLSYISSRQAPHTISVSYDAGSGFVRIRDDISR